MNIAYSTILKVDRMQSESGGGASVLTESEHDLDKVTFSPALQRLQNLAQIPPFGASQITRSRLTNALQTAQVGRRIVLQITAQLEGTHQANRMECAALTNTVETACLIRDLGAPPFGQAGEAAIRRWFADRGPVTMRAACQHYAMRGLEPSDPRLVNALADFREFDSNPQRLRVLAKFHWGNKRHGLNLSKTCLASTMQYLRITGGKSGEPLSRAGDEPGFFSTEAGLVKSIWSAFDYDRAPQRFPLNYVVEAAGNIVSALGTLDAAIESNLLTRAEAVNAIRDSWLSTYIPADPDPADEGILNLLNDASSGKNAAGDDFGFVDLHNALIATMCDYAARQYLDQHEQVFSGTLATLFPAESGSGALLAAMRTCYRQHVCAHPQVQLQEMRGYALVFGLLDRFRILLETSSESFQATLRDVDERQEIGKPFCLERNLLALIPAEYRSAYVLVTAHLGNGRDVEFEEWNARAHLVVDYIAGLTEPAAATLLNTLMGP